MKRQLGGIHRGLGPLGGNPLGGNPLGGNPLYILLFYSSCLSGTAFCQQKALDQIVPIDSMELMGKIYQARQYDVVVAALDSLYLQDSLLAEQVDSLQMEANLLAAEHNYIVRKVDRGENQLVERHFELTKAEKLLGRHAGWLDGYYRRVNFVRYRSHYPKKRDKWAKWVWIGSNILFAGRMGYDFTRK